MANLRGVVNKKVEIKLNMDRLTLDQVRNAIHKFSVAVDKLPCEGERSEQFLSALTEMLRANEEVLSNIQSWEDEAKKLLRGVGNAELGNIKQLEEYIRSNPPSAGAIAILVIEVAERERERMRKEKTKNFAPIREKATQQKIENARQLHDAINHMNADLLAKPASEGWGSKKKRANFIAEKTGRKFSYINKLLSAPRKTNQT